MFKRIFELLNEEWAGSVKTSWKKDDIIDVFKNPSKSEILKMTKGGRTPVRFFISFNGDLYVWAFDDAEHDEVARQLKQQYRVKGVYYSPQYVEFFKVMKPNMVYPEVENSKLNDLLDNDYHDNLLRKELSTANEEYLTTTENGTDIYENPSHIEISKMLKSSERNALRFIFDDWGNNTAYVWDAMGAVHNDVIEELELSEDRDYILGQLYKSGIYMYLDDDEESWEPENIEWFKNTDFYKNLKRIGISDIEFGMRL